jgi:Flp pilus assembly protein TadD
MRVILLTLPLIVLAACNPNPQSQQGTASGQSVLDMLTSSKGPKVTGVEGTLLESAQAAEEKRQFGRALQFYTQLVDKDKDNVVYQLGVADNMRRVGDYDSAMRAYNNILKDEPENIDAMEGKALTLLAKGETKESKDLFQNVLKKDKERWRTMNAIGILFVLNDMPQEALAYYNQALKVRPGEPATLNNLGLTYALDANYDSAIDALQRAAGKLDEKDPERQRVDLNLALVYALSGEMDRAEDVAGKHLSGAALNNNMGFYAMLESNDDLAKAYLNTALSGSPVFYERAWKNLEAIGGAPLSKKRK